MEFKHCTICDEDKPLDKFQLNPDGSIRKHVCKLCYGRKYRAQLKLEMLEVFGWKCQCCGEDHPMFLSLDHVESNGSEHRAKYESSNNNQIIADAKREGWPKDKYQLLCMNCNTAKGYYKECPHKTGLMAEEVIEDLKSKIFHTGKTLQSKVNKGLTLGPVAYAAKMAAERADPKAMALRTLSKLSKEDVMKLLQTLNP